MNIWKVIRQWFGSNASSGAGCCGGACACSAPVVNEKLPVQHLLQLSDNEMSAFRALDPKVVVGRIMAIEPHSDPKMTKVRVTKTEIEPGVVQTILCGAPNITEGMLVPVALVGAVLGDDFTITQRDIRGITSMGMICARRELGLEDPIDTGIWPLSEALQNHVGISLRDL